MKPAKAKAAAAPKGARAKGKDKVKSKVNDKPNALSAALQRFGNTFVALP